MKVIALEEHMFPGDILESADLRLGPGPGDYSADLDEVGEKRIAMMDTAGIDVQVLSTVGNIVQDLDPETSKAISRALNDRMAEVVSNFPARFKGFATLPMTAPESAADELRRGTEELGFVGAMIHGQTKGVFLDAASTRPILAMAERLHVPIYLHPAPPPSAVHDAYFSDLDPAVAGALARGAWGWHAECGMHVLRMIAGGVFERFPDLQLIIGHMGEGIPFHLDRIEERLSPFLRQHELTVAETLHRNVHITTSGYNTTTPLLCAMTAFGADRILFSVDYPFADSEQATSFLRGAPISPHDRKKIAHRNAERLLGI